MLDLGTRPNELLCVEWRNVAFASCRGDCLRSERRMLSKPAVHDHGSVTLIAKNTKSQRERQVDMTPRVAAQLNAWQSYQQKTEPRAPELVFGGIKSVKTSWERSAGLPGIGEVRIYDQRHTTATRLVEEGMELSQVGRILGHTTPKTTYRYANATKKTRQTAAQLLARRAAGEPRSQPATWGMLARLSSLVGHRRAAMQQQRIVKQQPSRSSAES